MSLEENKHEDVGIEDNGKGVSHILDKDDLGKTPTTALPQDVLEDAVRAEEVEHSLTIRQAFKLYYKAVWWSFAFSLIIIMEGYDTALLNNFVALPVFREKYGTYSGNPKKGYQLSAAWQNGLGQGSNVGGIIGVWIGSWFQDRYGYKRTIQIALVGITGAIFVVFFAPNVQVLLVGRILCGLPWGAFSTSAVSYASEVTPVALRAYLTTYINICWIIGQFIAAGVIVGVDGRSDQWAYRLPFALQWMWPVPLFILITLAPESPWWLVRAGRLEDAKNSLRRLARDGDQIDVAGIVAMMVRTNEHEILTDPRASFWDCFKGFDLRRTEISCLAWSIQVLCGAALGYQAAYFFEQAGLQPTQAFKFNLGLNAVAFIGTAGSWFTMTYFGRRKVYLTGLSILAVLLLLIGVLTIPAKTHSGAKWAQAALVLMWTFTYDFTLGPLAYCIVAETSSTRLRSKTVGLARNTYNISGIWAGILATYMLNPTAWNWGTYSSFFWLGTCIGSLVWSYFRLPECSGRTYRELDILFERGISARKFQSTIVTVQEEN